MRIALLFPGQGSQYVGMGKDFYENYDEAKYYFKKVDEILKDNLTSIIFNGPEELLSMTENTQPSILTVSTIAFTLFKNKIKEPKFEFVAGHSLGEYSAYVAAESIMFDDAILAVRKRAQFMQEAVRPDEGAMAALIGLEIDDVKKICEEASSEGIVVPANDNCPSQTVIAGEKKAVDKAVEIAKGRGCKKAVYLKVSAPFHSPLMKPAREKMEEVLKQISFKDPIIPCISNVTAEPVKKGEMARELLIKQIDSPVRWRESVLYLKDNGIDTLIEIGPQSVLSNLAKRISKDFKTYNIEDCASLEKCLNEIWGG